MSKKYLAILTSSVAALSLLTAQLGFAAANPSGTGQPSQSCQLETMSPSGFNTNGFINATAVYAGSPGTPSLANGNSHAVSQYDVACFQVTSNSK